MSTSDTGSSANEFRYVKRKDITRKLWGLLQALYNDQEFGARVFYIHGLGGLGKTSFQENLLYDIDTLLRSETASLRGVERRMAEVMREKQRPVIGCVIDFIHPDNRDKYTIARKMLDGLLLSPSDQAYEKEFRLDRTRAAEFAHIYAKLENLAWLELKEQEAREEEAFDDYVEQWNKLSAERPIIIRFDTLERLLNLDAIPEGSFMRQPEVQGQTILRVSEFLLNLLPKLKRTLFIMSGRPSSEDADLPQTKKDDFSSMTFVSLTSRLLQKGFYDWPNQERAGYYSIKGFSTEETKEYVNIWCKHQRGQLDNAIQLVEQPVDLVSEIAHACKLSVEHVRDDIMQLEKAYNKELTLPVEPSDLQGQLIAAIMNSCSLGDGAIPLFVWLYLDYYRLRVHSAKETPFFYGKNDEFLIKLANTLFDPSYLPETPQTNKDRLAWYVRVYLAQGRGGLTIGDLFELCQRSDPATAYEEVVDCLQDDPLIRKIPYWHAPDDVRQPVPLHPEDDLYYLHDEVFRIVDLYNNKSGGDYTILAARPLLVRQAVRHVNEARKEFSSGRAEHARGKLVRAMSDHIIYSFTANPAIALRHMYIYASHLIESRSVGQALALIDTFWRLITLPTLYAADIIKPGEEKLRVSVDLAVKRPDASKPMDILKAYDRLLFLQFLRVSNTQQAFNRAETAILTIAHKSPLRWPSSKRQRRSMPRRETFRVQNRMRLFRKTHFSDLNYYVTPGEERVYTPHVAIARELVAIFAVWRLRSVPGANHITAATFVVDRTKKVLGLLECLEKHVVNEDASKSVICAFERGLFRQRAKLLYGKLYSVSGQALRQQGKYEEAASRYAKGLECLRLYSSSLSNNGEGDTTPERIDDELYEIRQSYAFLRTEMAQEIALAGNHAEAEQAYKDVGDLLAVLVEQFHSSELREVVNRHDEIRYRSTLVRMRLQCEPPATISESFLAELDTLLDAQKPRADVDEDVLSTAFYYVAHGLVSYRRARLLRSQRRKRQLFTDAAKQQLSNAYGIAISSFFEVAEKRLTAVGRNKHPLRWELYRYLPLARCEFAEALNDFKLPSPEAQKQYPNLLATPQGQLEAAIEDLYVIYKILSSSDNANPAAEKELRDANRVAAQELSATVNKVLDVLQQYKRQRKAMVRTLEEKIDEVEKAWTQSTSSSSSSTT